MSVNLLIIGGTEKAGTTSVFSYLNEHPDVCCSSKKETDFFRMRDTPIDSAEMPNYWRYFRTTKSKCLVEASPGYLADSEYSAKQVQQHLPKTKFIFILREPIARLISSFTFHKSRLNISEAMSFDYYVELCLGYANGLITEEQSELEVWFLRVLDAGRYFHHLSDYYSCFPSQQISVFTYDELTASPAQVIHRICALADLPPEFYDGYNFYHANMTFDSKNKRLHGFALKVNDRLEPFFNANPVIKRKLLSLYKIFNAKATEKPIMSVETRRKIETYYADDIRKLADADTKNRLHYEKWLAGYVNNSN